MGDSSDDDTEHDINQGGKAKDLVHKCVSDPGNVLAHRGARMVRHPTQAAGATRKCVLTLDGYSYVIGKDRKKLFISLLKCD